ncbi:MAG: DUF2339 domain-containing protein [Dokdonella sp.]|uniref:DUF2339 domain-containing protein n=1 Tax=Dokdonella sp. TaxID=2291710 RepID=UPI003F7DCC3F
MGFLIVVAACIGGLFVGGVFGNNVGFGFFGGLAIGLAFARLRALAERVDALDRQLDALQRMPAALRPDAPPRAESINAAASVRAPSPVPTASAPVAPVVDPLPAPPPIAPAPAARPTAPAPAPHVATRPPRSSGPDPLQRFASGLKRWFSEGNVPVKVGMLVLFAGVAALLKYAADEGWLSLPIELRLAGVALAAIAALAFGWRERARRPSFGLALQGGAIGVLLLTVFAAFRFYHLIPAGAAFALMLVLVAGAGVLAVLQDALALAVLGLLAGFAAPILISTGSGDHVVLFSYYALLNLAIFAIAWARAWRVLNLLGFFSTYAIGTAWGVLRYEHALFGSTEPFLLVFFAIYLAIPVLDGLRREPAARGVIDGTLVFGNPLVAFALQAALLDGERMPLAWSALGLALVYAVLAATLIKRRRVLGESFAVLAVGFATLAVPLALSARSTASTFALEGAALVWLGLREQRRLPRLGGLALQALAAFAFAFALADGAAAGETTAIANGTCISALLIALAAFTSAWLYHRREDARRELAVLLYLWGLAWWLGAGLREIDRFVVATRRPAAVLVLLAVTAAGAALATRRTRAFAPALTTALALAAGVLVALAFGDANLRPFAGWGLAAFATYAIAGVFALVSLGERRDLTPALAQIGWLWTWTCAATVALSLLALDLQLGAGWRIALTAAPVLAAWALALLRPAWIAAPLAQRFAEWRAALLLLQAIAATCILFALFRQAGDSASLPYLPVFNPVELVQLGVLLLGARWLADADSPRDLAARRAPLLAAGGFLFVTAATLRATHQLGGIPWDEHLWSSNLAQTALTVVWSALGVLGWVLGSRRGQRALWLAGALLMGVVLAKLLLVDRTHLGNLFGIASFIAYGLLCTVIGYFAPAPPRAATEGAST